MKNLLLRRKVEEILSSLRNILMKLHEVPDQFLDHIMINLFSSFACFYFNIYVLFIFM